MNLLNSACLVSYERKNKQKTPTKLPPHHSQLNPHSTLQQKPPFI
jgi:hypothetical protein